MTHPDPFTSNTAFEEVMSEIKADEGGGPAFDPGPPAFPSFADTHEGHQMKECGMSLRDFFAAQVIAECIRTRMLSARDAALSSYAIADAMLEARKAKT